MTDRPHDQPTQPDQPDQPNQPDQPARARVLHQELSRVSLHDTRSNELVAEVISDHGLTQEEVADGCGLSQGQISRILSGQYAPPPALARYLYSATEDRRLIVAMLGVDAATDFDAANHNQSNGKPAKASSTQPGKAASTQPVIGYLHEIERMGNDELRSLLITCCQNLCALVAVPSLLSEHSPVACNALIQLHGAAAAAYRRNAAAIASAGPATGTNLDASA